MVCVIPYVHAEYESVIFLFTLHLRIAEICPAPGEVLMYYIVLGTKKTNYRGQYSPMEYLTLIKSTPWVIY